MWAVQPLATIGAEFCRFNRFQNVLLRPINQTNRSIVLPLLVATGTSWSVFQKCSVQFLARLSAPWCVLLNTNTTGQPLVCPCLFLCCLPHCPLSDLFSLSISLLNCSAIITTSSCIFREIMP